MNLKDNLPKENRYYETENGILYNADCLDMLKQIPDNSVDLVLTDPPYGIGITKQKTVGGGSKRYKVRQINNIDWDVRVDNLVFDLIFKVSNNQIIWGGNYYINYLYPTRCMLVWYKRDGLPIRSFADCEIAWTSFDKNSMVFNCRWDGFIRDSREKKTGHPTQKALELFKWCVSEFSNENDLILDPFLGSGTTAVACEMLNRKWIGIELNKEYCDIIVERLKKKDVDIQI
jgi:site-specific DNA-methyltransferase (adenine-specific)